MLKIRKSFRDSMRVLGILSVIWILTLLVSCDRFMTGKLQRSATQAENFTHEQLTESFTNLLGQTVSVRGETQERVGDFTFLLNEDQLLATGKVLIINMSGEDFFLPIERSVDVQVTGAVRKFVRADLEKEFNLSLNPDLFVEYDQHPVIVAQTIILAPHPRDIADNPEQYYNQQIVLEGQIGRVLNRHAFTVNDESSLAKKGVLVANPASKVDYQVDEAMVAKGILRVFVAAEVNQQYELAWSSAVLHEIEAKYQNRPVLMADEVDRRGLGQGQSSLK